ncbi:hypothetical protein MCI_06730 [Rickettsia montanensis str. OSU 85-930]|uniref:Uncharacterized protein n=1 Tax=Rickettsia montanensis (strain OSU 85-930) TaxID=1105114 RepID=H8KDE0_RICMS|nr:hypothetical protein MCI_06730 [Rickettsia montanensis str. OSU 85-930]
MLKKYNSHINEQLKINTIQKYLGAKSANNYKDMDVNDYNYDLPDNVLKTVKIKMALLIH